MTRSRSSSARTADGRRPELPSRPRTGPRPCRGRNSLRAGRSAQPLDIVTAEDNAAVGGGVQKVHIDAGVGDAPERRTQGARLIGKPIKQDDVVLSGLCVARVEVERERLGAIRASLALLASAGPRAAH